MAIYSRVAPVSLRLLHRRAHVRLGLAAALCLVAGCGASTPASPPPPAVTADTWAVVDGRTITRTAVEQAYQRVRDLSQALSEEELLAAKLTTLNDLIIQDLLLAKARAEKVEPSAADVDAAFAEARKGVTDEALQQELTRRSLTLEDMRESLRRDLITQKLIGQDVLSKITVSDQEVASYFEANRQQFNLTEEAHRVAQIVVTSARDPRQANRTGDDAATPEAATAKIEMLMGRLKSGASFADLAADYSEDPESAPRGGDLGLVPMSQLRQAPAALRDAVLKVPAGTVTVVNSSAGHIIVLVLAHEPAGQRDLSNPEVRENITATLRARREQLLRAAYLTTLRGDAKVDNLLARRLLEARGAIPSLGPAAPAAR